MYNVFKVNVRVSLFNLRRHQSGGGGVAASSRAGRARAPRRSRDPASSSADELWGLKRQRGLAESAASLGATKCVPQTTCSLFNQLSGGRVFAGHSGMNSVSASLSPPSLLSAPQGDRGPVGPTGPVGEKGPMVSAARSECRATRQMRGFQSPLYLLL